MRELLADEGESSVRGADCGITVFSERRFLVSARWWRQWCDYVNLELLEQQVEDSSLGSSGGSRLLAVLSSPAQDKRFSASPDEGKEEDEGELSTMRRMQRELREMKARQQARKSRGESVGAFFEDSSLRYKRPGPIINRGLVVAGMSMYLKPNLVEHHDYEALPAAVWKHLYSWYTADLTLVRDVKMDRSTERRYLDLYPGNGI